MSADTPQLHDRLGYLLKHAQLRLAEHAGPALAPLGVTGRDLAVLTVLDTAVPLAQQQAASRLGIDRTTMVELVDQLEGRGLVARGPDPADRRRNLVQLTGEGRRVLTDGARATRAAESTFLAALDPAAAEQFRKSLKLLLGVD
ncbi:MarR family transcriptional regulator [Actinoplanes sp. TBRC 11911]|uniref:MarR family winged helix-turn-helix transcriptional regulator n=1 Tax=Actinoplanes sp. TBRC 11911 TaxID=2729386 RepID=UPI00145F0D51|nr:MarR family transcriptional regulator [Actinoplanes sp. TBRC 11911]NMO54950.1 MarR family transcriptional regulator [Actinoplanes sp. TBRC 11911]